MKPIIIITAAGLLSLGGGAAAGWFLHPKPVPEEMASCEAPPCEPMAEAYNEPDPDISYEYVRLSGQFVVPVLDTERVRALVVLSLTLESKPGLESTIEDKEPKLRDALLQVLFNHAQTGGFDGAFTTGQAMRDLRAALTAAARGVVGPDAHGVLVTDVVKQDL
jgi:flagellar basal body-associated protein FliL